MAALCNRAGHIFMLWFLLMVALCNRADHYIFILFLSSSSSSSSFFFSSPNLSGRRLDVYHTLTGWRRGVVVIVVRRMNEVTLRRARLVLGWVTVFGRVYHHGT